MRFRFGLVLLPLALVGCAPVDTSTSPEPTPSRTVEPVVSFRECADVPADPGTTHLRPVDEFTAPPYDPSLPGLSGPVHLQHMLSLHLPDGAVRAGDGYAVMTTVGEYFKELQVEDGPLDAVVTSSVWEPGDDRRVAWMELSFGTADPVRWESVPDLDIGTDGGDGGFFSTNAAGPEDDVEGGEYGLGRTFDAYMAAFSPEDGSFPLCVIRATDGVEDGFAFSTGIGDGWYPTYAGYAADGSLVSLLNDGGMPWETAGVPGEPPPDYLAPDWA